MSREELDDVLAYANSFLDGLGDRGVGWTASVDELRASMGGPLPQGPSSAAEVIRDLIKAADAGIVGTTSPRYFGFVIGGHTPSSLAADWLTSLWDQNPGLFVGGPAASVAEEVAGNWIIEMLGLPADASFGSSRADRWPTTRVSRRRVITCWRPPDGTSRRTACKVHRSYA